MKDKSIFVKCGDCGIDIEVSLKHFKSVEPNHIWRCKSCMNKYFSKKMKEYHSNLSNEEKLSRVKKALKTKKEHPNEISEERKAEISAKRTAAQKRRWANLSPDDKDRLLKPLLDGKKEYYSSMTEEKWKEFGKAVKDGKSKMSESDKQSMLNNMSIGMKKWWSKVDDKYKDNQMNNIHEKYKEYWNNLNDNDKELILNRMHNGWDNWYDNLSDAEVLARNNKLNSDLRKWWKELDEDTKIGKIIYLNDAKNEWWNNLSDEEKYEHYKPIIESLYYAHEKWWNELPDTEKDVLNDKLISEHKRWWDNLPDNERKEFGNKSSEWWHKLPNSDQERIINNHKDYWNLMPISSKEAFIKKILSSARGKNKFHQLFESRFNNLESSYKLIEEYPISSNGVTHCWDYAIFRDNELCMLIDLDGVYFHADDRDYDGMHSKLEYDEKRGLSSQNIPICIIYEQDFDKSFAYMCSLLNLSYEEFIDKRLREYHNIPFPELYYFDVELIRSYNDLCKLNCDDKYHRNISLNTRVGDRLIQHFHPSIYHDKRAGKLSPYEAWQDDNMLRNMIEQGYLYHSYLNKNKILQGFNIYEPAQRVSILSAGKAKMIMHRYLSEYDEVFNPFSGYGGVMLACIAMNKRYIGQDISEVHVRESLSMLSFLKDNGVDMNASLSVADSSQTTGTYQCLFANDMNDDLIDICIKNYKCERYVFIISNTEKYVNNIVEIMKGKSYLQKDQKIILIERKV